jgi:predicted nucleotidyltransferase
MVQATGELVERIVSRLVAALSPREIYLFGSQARGEAGAHSDLDFLIVVDDDAGDPHDLAGRGWLALKGLKVPVDLVVLHQREMDKWSPVRFSLPHTVKQRGKLVHAA